MTVEIRINGLSRFVRANNNHELQTKLADCSVFDRLGRPRKSYSLGFDGVTISFDAKTRVYSMHSLYGESKINGMVNAILDAQFPSEFAKFADNFANNAKNK